MILVTGANGQLGMSVQRLLNALEDYANQVIYTDIAGNCTHLDITDRNAVCEAVAENKVDVIVNCAAYTNVDKAEDDVEMAMRINADAVGNLAHAAKLSNALLIHVSTDYVFGGNLNNTPCREDQPTNPTGVYGYTKLKGEEQILASGCNYVVIRTAWLYSEFGKNFVKTMLSLTATKPQLKVVFDQVGTPTYAADLANAIVTVINDYENSQQASHDKDYSKSGIYHFSNEGVCSWFDFTKMIAQIAGNNDCDIQPCHSSEFPSKVVRPSYSVLDKTKIKDTFNIYVPYWTESLRKCIMNICE